MNKLDAALAYAAQGWNIVHLYWIENGYCSCGKQDCKSPGKHPIPANGLKVATTDPVTIGRWFTMFPRANIGIATGRESGIWALDVDPGKGGDDSFNSMSKRYDFPDCFHSMTGGGGDHWIFAYPVIEGISIPSRVEILPGLDVRGDGGYIVAPPSDHISGALYEWEDGYSPFDEDSEELFAEISPSIGKQFGLYRELKAESDSGEPMFQSAPAWNIDEAELKKIKVALSMLDADSRDHWLAAGMALHSTGWDHSFQLWCEWAIQSDKFDIGDSRRVWNSFHYRADGSTLGSLYHLANEISPGWTSGEELRFIDDTNQPNDAQIEALAELPFFTAGELLDSDLQKPESLWMDGAISPGDIIGIYGPPKVKKSFFAMGLAMAAACGGEFLGSPFSRPLRVMWIQAELKKEYLKERFEKMVGRFGPEDTARIRDNFLMSDRLTLIIDREPEFLKLVRTVSYYKPDLIMIDPLFNFTLCEENDASKVRHLLIRLSKLRELVPGLSVAVVHHAKKDIDLSSPFESIRGSGAFRGYHDFGVMLTPTAEGPRKAYFDTRNREEMKPLLLEVDDSGRWSTVQFEDDRVEGEVTTRENQILASLESAGSHGIKLIAFESIISAILNCSPEEAGIKRRQLTNRKIIKAIGPRKDRSYILPRFWLPNMA